MTETEEIKAAIITKVYECMSLADSAFGITFPTPVIKFTKRGRAAGNAKTNILTGLSEVNFNMTLALENTEHFLYQTVPHEVAHVVAHTYYKKACGHGRLWKNIMTGVYGLVPDRCHQYDTTNSRIKRNRLSREFVYKCDCREVALTSIRHKKVLKGASYSCTRCRKDLKFVSNA